LGSAAVWAWDAHLARDFTGGTPARATFANCINITLTRITTGVTARLPRFSSGSKPAANYIKVKPVNKSK
jgi:hypothetical protein